MSKKRELNLFIVAGEPSGDQIGASIVRSMRRLHTGKINVFGIGGSRLLDEGFLRYQRFCTTWKKQKAKY